MGQAAERGLYMIEIIREESFDSEQEKRELPKNIRQIGSPDIGDRIYIENKVHEYMHPYDALQEKTVYVLLGRFENMIDRKQGIEWYKKNADTYNPIRYDRRKVKKRKCSICGREFDPCGTALKICSPECNKIRKREWQRKADAKRRGRKKTLDG